MAIDKNTDSKEIITVNGEKNRNEYWYPEEVIPYIIGDLKKRFPDSIIRRESDKVDIIVLMEAGNIPVEIQKTYARSGTKGIRISAFEDLSRRQVDQNIEISGICYFFLDTKLLEYLRNISCTSISLNMKWLYQYYIEGKVKVFSITRNGTIKELREEDLSILTKFSITDLDRNRHKIEYNVLKWRGYTTDEINRMYNSFEKNNTGHDKYDRWLYRKEATNREIEYGKICVALGHLNCISNILDCSENNATQCVSYCRDVGLFNKDGGNGQGKYARTSFTDEAHIAQYIDGYKDNKELWEYIRIHPVETRTFYRIITGEYPNFLKDRNCQKDLLEY